MASKNKFLNMAANLMSDSDLQLKMLELTCTLSGSRKVFSFVSARSKIRGRGRLAIQVNSDQIIPKRQQEQVLVHEHHLDVGPETELKMLGADCAWQVCEWHFFEISKSLYTSECTPRILGGEISKYVDNKKLRLHWGSISEFIYLDQSPSLKSKSFLCLAQRPTQ